MNLLLIRDIYLVGYVLVLGICTLRLYRKYYRGENISLFNIFLLISLPLTSWWGLFELVLRFVSEHSHTTIIKGREWTTSTNQQAK
jgi:hypothetical protein